MYIIGAFHMVFAMIYKACMGYNVGHVLSVVHGPLYGLPLDLP